MLAFIASQNDDMIARDQAVCRPLQPQCETVPAASDTRRVEDGELLQRISQRDREAFAALYDRYATVLYSLCMAILKKQEDAEDVLQESLLMVWEKAFTFNNAKGSAYTWLVTLTRNRAIDRLRANYSEIRLRQQPDYDFETIADESVSTPLESTSLAERAGIVQKAFAQLTAEQREVLHLAYFEGYSQSQIARRLQLPLGTVKTRVRQAMRKLHRLLINHL
jgi:RNA polymerase sigma-70 factor (ECF subfamily)